MRTFASAELSLTVHIVDEPRPAPCFTGFSQDDSIAAACGNGVLDGGERCDSSSADDKQHCEGAALCEVALAGGAELELAHARVTGPALVSFEERSLGVVPTHLAFAGGAYDAYRPISQCERVYLTELDTSFAVRAYGDRQSLALSIVGPATVELSAKAEWEVLQLSSESMPVSLSLQEIENADGTYSTVPSMPLDLELLPLAFRGIWPCPPTR